MNRIKKIINKLFGKNCSASSIGIIGGINGPTSIFTVKTNDEQKETANGIMRDIDLFKGVSQEDIDNRTPRFMGYVVIGIGVMLSLYFFDYTKLKNMLFQCI